DAVVEDGREGVLLVATTIAKHRYREFGDVGLMAGPQRLCICTQADTAHIDEVFMVHDLQVCDVMHALRETVNRPAVPYDVNRLPQCRVTYSVKMQVEAQRVKLRRDP